MASFVRHVIGRSYFGGVQGGEIQAKRARSTSQVSSKNPLNKMFIEPVVYPDLSTTFRQHITTTVTAFVGAATSPLLAMDAVPFAGKIAAVCMIIPSVFAIRRLYQFRCTPVQSTREVELMKEYLDRSDAEIKEELKCSMSGMLPNNSDFYDEHIQSLMKPWITTSSIERACVPMFIRYKIAHEKYQAIEELVPLMEAIADTTPTDMKGRLYLVEGQFFHDLFRTKLEAAFALAILCYPTDIEESHLNDLGLENPCFPENMNIKLEEVPFFIKKGSKLTKGFHSHKFTNRGDFISSKQIGDLSVPMLAEELMSRTNINNLVQELNGIEIHE